MEAGSRPREGSLPRQAGAPIEFDPGTLVDLFLAPIESDGTRLALMHRTEDGNWERLSFNDVAERVRLLALGLRAAGLGRGDRVAIIAGSSLEWALADFAIIMAGVISVPIYDTLSARETAYVLGDAEARAAFVAGEEEIEKLAEVADELPELRQVWTFDGTAPARPLPFEVASLESLSERGSAATDLAADYESYARTTKPDDLASLIYTSGTTDRPKGVMLSHNNFYSNSVLSCRRLPIGDDDLALSWLPLAHVFERTAGHFATWWAAAPVAYAESVDTVVRDMGEVRPTYMTAVPRLYEKFYEGAAAAARAGGALKERIFQWAKATGEARADRVLANEPVGFWLSKRYGVADRLVFSKLRARTGERLRYFISGGAALPPPIAKFFWGAGLRVLEGYGLTETSPVIAVNPKDAVKLGTVGPPIEGTEVRIADDGEILARGPGIMQGYYKKEEETRDTLDPDGWLRTGDIGELDADGYLKITDRKKEVIVTSYGKNVAPQPVEDALKSSPFVDQAVLIGNGRKFVTALVVPDFKRLEEWADEEGEPDRGREALAESPEAIALLEREADDLLGDFADFERPKRILLLPDELTIEDGSLTPTLKVKRRVVVERYRDMIERVYEQVDREADAEEAEWALGETT